MWLQSSFKEQRKHKMPAVANKNLPTGIETKINKQIKVFQQSQEWLFCQFKHFHARENMN